MAARPPTDTLRFARRALLLRMADPQPNLPALETINAAEIGPLLDAAGAHAVLPVVWRRLSEAPHVGSVDQLEKAKYDVAILSGQSMLLAHFARQITAAFEQANLRYSVVKGPVFAGRIYPNRADRSFTDIDVLVHHDDLVKANALMKDLNFVEACSADRPSDVYGEYKWQPPDGRNVLIELHADLVHSPKLRSRISLTYEALLEAGDGDPQAPAALMLVAGMHASFGHQFERLQLLVDVLQAARHAVHSRAEKQVVHACRHIGGELAVATALDLASSAFNEPVARDLANRVSDNKLRYLAKALVSPRIVAGAQDRTASWRSWRCKLYRQMLRLSEARAAA